MREFRRSTNLLWAVVASTAVLFPSLRTQAQTNYSLAYTFTTFAGHAGSGSADGIGSDAQFLEPIRLAADRAGNIYVADEGNGTIRKINPAGVVSTIAGFPRNYANVDGLNAAARFYDPIGIAADALGNLFVSDNQTIRRITPAGTNWLVTTIAGLAGANGASNGINGDARFNYPSGMAVDTNGNLFVADSSSYTIRKITPVGNNWVVSTFAGEAGVSGTNNATGTNAHFGSPCAIALDNNMDLYIADAFNNSIRRIVAFAMSRVPAHGI